MTFDVEKIRQDFPILKRKIDGKPLVFLDSASTSQKPVQMINAIKEYYEMYNANPHRSLYKLCEEATELYEESRKKVAKFINAKHPEEIIFVRNTNEAMNLLAHSYAIPRLGIKDEIVVSIMEHHANIVPWQFVSEKKGTKLRFADMKDDWTLDLNKLNLTKASKIVSLTHVSNVLGAINPVKEVSKIARDNGSVFIVDGAQSAPHMPIDVQDIGCDFFAFSGHKMLGPMSIGVLYGKKDLLEDMEPFLRGSDMIKEVTKDNASWNDLPWKFEAGTPNVDGAVGLSAAIDYLNKLGMKNIREHEKQITGYALKRLSEINGLEIYGPTNPSKRGGVISFNLADIHSHDLASIMNDFGIAIRSGHHCCMPLMKRMNIPAAARASFYIYTTKSEIDVLANALEKAKSVFKVD